MSPAQIVLAKRNRADPFARRAKDSIGDCGPDRAHGWLANLGHTLMTGQRSECTFIFLGVSALRNIGY